MNETTYENPSEEADVLLMELGKWMGRRDAFGQVAGRCSAAEIESLRRIHDGKLYQALNCTWEEFCAQYLRVSARTVERELAHLRRFGPAFFTVRQQVRLSAREFAAISGCISEQGVRVNGETVALNPESGEKVAEAVKTLLEQCEPPAPPAPFEVILRRIHAAAAALQCSPDELEPVQAEFVRLELGNLLIAISHWEMSILVPAVPGRVAAPIRQ